LRPDAVLYLLTQPYLSARRQQDLSQGLIAASSIPAAVARMEGTGPGPVEALDALVAGGARAILVQPVGLPFSDSLLAWLPGALAHWLARPRPEAVSLALAGDQAENPPVLAALAEAALARASSARPIMAEEASITNPGWQEPPPFRHHLLICTGPRCTFRGAGSIRESLYAALRRAGIFNQCHITLTGCLFPCNQGPTLAVYPAGHWYRLENEVDIARFAAALAADASLPDLIIHKVHP